MPKTTTAGHLHAPEPWLCDGRPWLTAWYPLVRRPLHARVWWDSVWRPVSERIPISAPKEARPSPNHIPHWCRSMPELAHWIVAIRVVPEPFQETSSPRDLPVNRGRRTWWPTRWRSLQGGWASNSDPSSSDEFAEASESSRKSMAGLERKYG